MSEAHAMAMVKWKVFRPGRLGLKTFDYGSNQAQLIKKIGDGGTLWLVTSRRKGSEARRYHLAYKLVNCSQIPREMSGTSGKLWKYVVRGDTDKSVHFKYNDVTDVLRRLTFTTGRPMAEVSNIGLRLMSIPCLTKDDSELLNRFEHKVTKGRTAFISYSHKDESAASQLELELGKRDIVVARDVSFLRAGENYVDALARAAGSTDCFLVLLSRSSGRSKWVGKEIDWAADEYRKKNGLVKKIVPVAMPNARIEEFPSLNELRIHCRRYEARTNPEFFDKLAADIVSL